MTHFSAALALAGLLAASSSASAETLSFTAKLDGASEVPATMSKGTGELTATLDTTTKALNWKGDYSGLTGEANAAHFHGPALPGATAGVAVPVAPLKSPFTGTATLSDTQVADLTSGKWYFNVHTAMNPKGEIRGQMLQTK